MNTVLKIDVSDVSNINNYNWSTLTDTLSSVRAFFSTAIIGDFIYIVGGITGDYSVAVNIMNTVEMLDSTTDTIVSTTVLPDYLGASAVISIDKRLYVFGGFHTNVNVVDSWYYSNVMLGFCLYLLAFVLYKKTYSFYFQVKHQMQVDIQVEILLKFLAFHPPVIQVPFHL